MPSPAQRRLRDPAARCGDSRCDRRRGGKDLPCAAAALPRGGGGDAGAWHAACFSGFMVRIEPIYWRAGWLLVAGVCAQAAESGAGAAAAPQAAAFQDVAALEALARTTAAAHLPPLSDLQRFLVGPLPPRLQLPRCAQELQPVVGPAPHPQDRVLVEIRCAEAPVWHIYVPVRIVGTARVAVAAHAIVPGSVLTAGDLRMEQHDLTEVPPGYLDAADIAIGRTAARPISGGAILSNQLLVVSLAVQRGQTVTLLANAGGINVRMAGRALSDGMVNQRVRVQNLSSGKVVEGIARSAQVVEIIFQ